MALPFNPASLSTLILWLDASDPASLVTNGTSVVQWRDKSIYQNHTAISSTTAPLLSSINGISSVYFNSRSGNPQYFQGPLSTLTTQQSTFRGFQSTFYVFTVATMTSTCVRNFNRSLVQLGSNTLNVNGTLAYQFQQPLSMSLFRTQTIMSTATTQYVLAQGAATRAWINEDIPLLGVPAYNRPFQCTYWSQYSQLSIFTEPARRDSMSINGGFPEYDWTVEEANANARRYSIGGSLLGVPDARTCWDGHIAEVLVYTIANQRGSFSLNQIQEVQGYLARKWGIVSELVPSHPYKPSTIQLSTIFSAGNVDLGSSSKLFSLPSSSAVPSQMVWLQGNNVGMSTGTFLPTLTDSINTVSNTNLDVSQQFPNTLFANNGSNGWVLQSRFGGTTTNLSPVPYSYFATRSTIGTFGGGALDYAYSIAVNSNSQYLAIGAPRMSSFAGRVFLLSKNTQSDTWVHRQIIAPSDTALNMAFGTSLSMSYDGSYLLVGSASNDIAGVTDVGAAYMFKKDPVSDLWNQVQKLTVSDLVTNLRVANYFQTAMTQDASVVALSSQFDTANNGAVFMFTKNPSADSWSQVQKITPPIAYAFATYFGVSIAMAADASYLVVGARSYPFQASQTFGATFVYKRDTGIDSWSYLQGLKINDQYQTNVTDFIGYNVSMSGTGTTILAACSNDPGVVYLFKKRTTTDFFDRIQTLMRPFDVIGSYFGFATAISYDGSFFAVSGSRNLTIGGAIVLYKKQSFTDYWVPYSTSNFSGTGIALAMDSNCTSFFSGVQGTRVNEYRQSTLTVVAVSSSVITVDTRSQKGTILLPPASATPGQMVWIKDSGNNAFSNPISISTPFSTFLMGNHSGLFTSENNVCMQFQSDGVSNYNLLNYFNGDTNVPISSSTFFVPMSIKMNSVTTTLSSFVYRINIRLLYQSNFFVNSATDTVYIPRTTINTFENIYFKSFDNQTILPHWCQPPTWTQDSNFFYVRIPYIDGALTTYYMYWDKNYIAKQAPFSTFNLFDDFSSAPGGQPDPERWSVQLRGSGTPSASQNSDGFMVLQGSDNQNSSASLISRYPVLTGNRGISNLYGFNSNSRALTNSNTFIVLLGYLCTSATGTILSIGVRSTIQDLAGAQTNWSITTLSEGASYYASNVTAHYGYRTSPGVAATIQASNITTSFGAANTWATLRIFESRVFENLTTTAIFSNAPLNQASSLYVHVAQTSMVGSPAPRLFINYIAAYDDIVVETIWGEPNQVLPSFFTWYS